jgi:hypothetical protein
MKASALLFGFLLFCAQCTGGSPPSGPKEAQRATAKKSLKPQKTNNIQDQNDNPLFKPENSASTRAYIDPETGEFITPPEPQVPATEMLAPQAAFSTSHDNLVEIPSPVAGGGTMVDLKGRFRSPLTATIDSSGKINIGHHSIEGGKE